MRVSSVDGRIEPFFMTRIVPAFSATNILPSGAVTTAVGRTNHHAMSSVSKPGAFAAYVSSSDRLINVESAKKLTTIQLAYFEVI